MRLTQHYNLPSIGRLSKGLGLGRKRPPVNLFNPLSLFEGGALGMLYDGKTGLITYKDAAATQRAAPGENIQVLADKTTYKKNSTQGTASFRPVLGDNSGFISFDGTDDFLTTMQVPYADGGTMSASVKFNALGKSQTIIGTTGSGSVTSIYIGISATNRAVFTAGTTSLNGTSVIPLDTWVNITATYEGAALSRKLRLYVNGVLEASFDTGNGNATGGNAFLGCRNNKGGTAFHMTGKVKSFFMSNVAINEEQIKDYHKYWK